MHENPLGNLFSAAGALWALVVMNAAALFRAWPAIMERINERRRDAASERAGDWTRLRDEVGRLSERVEALERKVDDCERERDHEREARLEAEAEVIRLKAYYEGIGEARQTAQLIVSKEREDDAAKKDKPNG